MDLVATILKQQEQLEGERHNWNSHWQQVADLVLPRRDFTTVSPAEGIKRTEKIFDATAPYANEQLASGLHGYLTSPALKWFKLITQRIELMKIKNVALWLEDVETKMYYVFNSVQANFHPQAHEMYLDLGAFGTSLMFVGELPNGIRYQTRPLSECYLKENDVGLIDTVYRKFEFTARQAAKAWGLENLPDGVKKALQDQPHKKFTFIHAVGPRGERHLNDRRARNKPWASYYVNLDHKHLISVSGYDEFPYLAPRWSKVASETYGRSPAMTVLPDIKMINEMSKTVLKAAQKIVDPPLQLPDDGFLRPIRTIPGGLNYYRSGSQDRIEPIRTEARPDIGLEMMEQRRDAILRAFYVDWMQMPDDREGAHTTATWVLQRREEKMRLMGPMLSRMQNEFLGPLIERTFAIMMRAGVFPTPPQELSKAKLDIEYQSPLASAQKASEAEGIGRMLALVSPFAEAKPEILENYNGDEIARYAAEIYNVPGRLVRSAEEVEESRQIQTEQMEQEQQQMQMAQMAATGKDAAAALKGVADAAAAKPGAKDQRPR